MGNSVAVAQLTLERFTRRKPGFCLPGQHRIEPVKARQVFIYQSLASIHDRKSIRHSQTPKVIPRTFPGTRVVHRSENSVYHEKKCFLPSLQSCKGVVGWGLAR